MRAAPPGRSPDELRERIDLLALLSHGADTLSLPLAEGTQHRLLDYLDLLGKWNRHYNLTSIRDPRQMLVQHVLDSLAVVPSLERHLSARRAVRLLDVGSGGGLPGVVLAIARPDWSVCCVDAVAKKAGFVRQVASELALSNLMAEHARVETMDAPPFDVIVSRAFASLVDFTALSHRVLAPEGCWLAMKGHTPDAEIAAVAASGIDVFHVEPLQVPGLDAQRCLVWMRPAQQCGSL